ncbi:hypothetical protein BN946_scf184575.g12 [Trametes cinnabarina]|uniref:Uncharacterized protein n=1 Tax=Pycnoporus cinnabarinus TaxID=5643 RepID=A0A060S4M8_PYCCI|nr:hypothetical protein BN946_scf184575.g12 [Trametes cinnabarina]
MAQRASTSTNPQPGAEGEIINELYFTGQGDPATSASRSDTTETSPSYTSSTLSTFRKAPEPRSLSVTYNEQFVVAFLDWALGVHLGSVIKGADREPMTNLVAPGSSDRARSFKSGRAGKEKFEWRRVGNKHPFGYELFSMDTESRIARYDPTPRNLPKVGRAYALLEYGFHEDNLIRDALLALCLNRWIDWRGM